MIAYLTAARRQAGGVAETRRAATAKRARREAGLEYIVRKPDCRIF